MATQSSRPDLSNHASPPLSITESDSGSQEASEVMRSLAPPSVISPIPPTTAHPPHPPRGSLQHPHLPPHLVGLPVDRGMAHPEDASSAPTMIGVTPVSHGQGGQHQHHQHRPTTAHPQQEGIPTSSSWDPPYAFGQAEEVSTQRVQEQEQQPSNHSHRAENVNVAMVPSAGPSHPPSHSGAGGRIKGAGISHGASGDPSGISIIHAPSSDVDQGVGGRGRGGGDVDMHGGVSSLVVVADEAIRAAAAVASASTSDPTRSHQQPHSVPSILGKRSISALSASSSSSFMDPTTALQISSSFKKETPYSRSPQLKVSHKLAERRRRKNMRDNFEILKGLLPNVDPGPKTSKWEILQKAVDYIEQLHSEREAMHAELARYRGEAPPLPPEEVGGQEAGGEEAMDTTGGGEQDGERTEVEEHHHQGYPQEGEEVNESHVGDAAADAGVVTGSGSGHDQEEHHRHHEARRDAQGTEPDYFVEQLQKHSQAHGVEGEEGELGMAHQDEHHLEHHHHHQLHHDDASHHPHQHHEDDDAHHHGLEAHHHVTALDDEGGQEETRYEAEEQEHPMDDVQLGHQQLYTEEEQEQERGATAVGHGTIAEQKEVTMEDAEMHLGHHTLGLEGNEAGIGTEAEGGQGEEGQGYRDGHGHGHVVEEGSTAQGRGSQDVDPEADAALQLDGADEDGDTRVGEVGFGVGEDVGQDVQAVETFEEDLGGVGGQGQMGEIQEGGGHGEEEGALLEETNAHEGGGEMEGSLQDLQQHQEQQQEDQDQTGYTDVEEGNRDFAEGMGEVHGIEEVQTQGQAEAEAQAEIEGEAQFEAREEGSTTEYR